MIQIYNFECIVQDTKSFMIYVERAEQEHQGGILIEKN